jgi:hypothetical protein
MKQSPRASCWHKEGTRAPVECHVVMVAERSGFGIYETLDKVTVVNDDACRRTRDWLLTCDCRQRDRRVVKSDAPLDLTTPARSPRVVRTMSPTDPLLLHCRFKFGKTDLHMFS